MAVDIIVPSVGESITEGTLARWLKKDGAVVRADEPVFELETEKATTEIAAPAAGVLKIVVAEGSTVAIGAVVGRIEEQKEVASAAPAKPKAKGGPALADAVPAPTVAETPRPGPAPRPEPAPAGAVLSPAARRLVEESAIDVQALTGTGRGGRVTKEDVATYLEQHAHPPAPPSGETPVPAQEPAPPLPPAGVLRDGRKAAAAPVAERETRQRMSSIRQRIAGKLVESQKSTATLTSFNEADLSAVIALRHQYKDRFRERYGVALGFMSFFVKACVEALRAYPIVNARIDDGDIVFHNYYNIGVAVSTERGLMVPVVHDADRLNFPQIEQTIAEKAEKARDGKIQVADLQGGTFTITNGGVFGSLLSTPILNPPQSAILGMHAIQKRPVALGDAVVIRPMMYVALSYDHRLIDGREAVLFLLRVKECIENPERLMLEI
jgi:2-oxoglutarate dehydrogenase E2 component (dihydrolipoamide succinyltransferase)